jgi:hypothetical protein
MPGPAIPAGPASCLLAALIGVVVPVAGAVADAGAATIASADALRDRFRVLQPRLQAPEPFTEPLAIDSRHGGGRLQAEVHAMVGHGFERVAAILAAPSRWCELLVLQPNIRQCRLADDGTRLVVRFARRFDQPLADTQPVAFHFRAERRADLLQVELHAPEGPLGTGDYRIALDATAAAADADRSLVRIRFSQAYGIGARLAASTYFATSGRNKVGFSVVGERRDGSVERVGGLRGGVERTAMRHYLAVDAVLASAADDGRARLEASLRRWLDAVGRYPLQLAEADPDAYFEAKRRPL